MEDHLHQLGYVHCFEVWVPHKLSKKEKKNTKKETFLIIFLHVILYLNIMKTLHF